MESEEIKEIVKEILELVKEIPDEYRLTTYEILLRSRLLGLRPTAAWMPGGAMVSEGMWDVKLPGEIKVFLKRNRIAESVLQLMFDTEGDLFIPTYEIDTSKKASAQISFSLLKALENALSDGKFRFAIDDIRKRVKEEMCHDGSNFQGIFKRNESLFKSLKDPKNVELSPVGMKRLAALIVEFTKGKD